MALVEDFVRPALKPAAPGCPSGLAPPEGAAPEADPAAFVTRDADGRRRLELMVKGAKCAGCIRKIESALAAMPGVEEARLNLSTGRLAVAWRSGALEPRAIVSRLVQLGYTALPFDPEAGRRETDQEGRRLLRSLAVAGFAMMNIMMFSVPVWSGHAEMGVATRQLLHLFSAVIAVAAALYAGRPFFDSALAALRRGRANMDVPISLAVFLTLGMSLFETLTGGMEAYFDGVCMLLFLLLIGRYLDHRLREKARTAAQDLLALQAVSAARIEADGSLTAASASALRVGDRVLLAAGDRAPVDGIVEDGVSELDCALLTGETAPQPIKAGDVIHAGAINLARPLVVRATAAASDSTIAQLARLIEIGEQGRSAFVRIADRAAQLYVPVVHTLAALTLIGWLAAPRAASLLGFGGVADIGFHAAMMNAITLLIITCPCALGLAVPAVQVVATGRLFSSGVLVKSGDALERLAQCDVVVLDKTGTLTLGKPQLAAPLNEETLRRAAALARNSRHPLSRALVEAAGPGAPADDVEEHAGDGLTGVVDGRPARLGRRAFAAPEAAPSPADALAELWFAWGDGAPVRIPFEDALRPDAAATIEALQARGLTVELLSGDRLPAVEAAARAAGIQDWQAEARPEHKTARLDALKAQGRRVLMVGDGLNDAAALACAHASASPGTAVEASQAAADIVFQGARLGAVIEAIDTARAARRRVKENLGFSVVYNLVAAPIAIAGMVTPLIAAAAMSGSSLAVTLNALRMKGRLS
jgi:Cu2+-exporting ATPase